MHMRLPLRFHLNRQTGAIGQTLENGLQGYQLIIHHLVFTFLPVGAELATVVIVLVRLDQPIFLAFYAGASLCYAMIFASTVFRVTRTAKDASAAAVDASALMTDGILNYETVKYFTAERTVQERVSHVPGSGHTARSSAKAAPANTASAHRAASSDRSCSAGSASAA